MTDWRLVPSALILAPLGLKKTSQFSLRRGWNVSYFNLTCSNGPGSCHVAATLDTELTWSTWKTSKKYRHWKTASFLNPTRNIKVLKPFYGSLSTFSNVRFPFKGWTWIRTKSETLNIDFDLLRHVCFLVPSSASKPPKNVGYSCKIFLTKSHLVFCKRTLWSPPWTTGLKSGHATKATCACCFCIKRFTVGIDREWRLRGECIETTPTI